MATNGADVLGFVNRGTTAVPIWVEVLSQTGLDIARTRALIDFSNKTSGDHTVNGPGRWSGTISLNSFFVEGDVSQATLEDAIDNGVRLDFLIRISGDNWKRAQGFLSNLASSFPDQAPSTQSATLTLDGKMTPA